MNFDEIINRRETASVKWHGKGDDFLPLWVADMDFKSPAAIIDAINERTKHGIFGYTYDDVALKEVVCNFYKKQYNYEINKDWIVFIPSVMPGAAIAGRISKGDLMINVPMYPCIRALNNSVDCDITEVPLTKIDGKYTFDVDAMKKALTKNIKAFVLCNPHNPVGRVFTKEELEQVVDFCNNNDLLLISDEIHSELIFEGKHIPIFSVNETAKNISVTLASPAKTYNIPGLPIGFAIIPNDDVRTKFVREASRGFGEPSVLAVEAFKAAYTKCDDWKQTLLGYLKENAEYVEARVANIKGLKANHNEGTYLIWIDASETGLEHPYKYFYDNANIKFSDGADFGDQKFIRVNIGCPRIILEEAFDRIENLLKEGNHQ